MPFNPFSALTSKIFGGIALAALLFAGVQTLRLSSAQADREDLRNALATERATHAVTRQSLAVLEGELAKMVRDGELRAERLAEAMDAQDERTAALKEQADRIAAEGAGDPCVTPDAVRGATGL